MATPCVLFVSADKPIATDSLPRDTLESPIATAKSFVSASAFAPMAMLARVRARENVPRAMLSNPRRYKLKRGQVRCCGSQKCQCPQQRCRQCRSTVWKRSPRCLTVWPRLQDRWLFR